MIWKSETYEEAIWHSNHYRFMDSRIADCPGYCYGQQSSLVSKDGSPQSGGQCSLGYRNGNSKPGRNGINAGKDGATNR